MALFETTGRFPVPVADLGSHHLMFMDDLKLYEASEDKMSETVGS